jgi:hypothetical protein
VGAYQPTRSYALTRRDALRQAASRYIEAHPGCTGNQLQAAIGGNRAVLIEAVRILIGEGHVVRHHDEADRRILRYTLAAGYRPPPPPPEPPPARPKRCEHCGGQLPPRKHRFCSDTCRARRQKTENVVENGTYAAGLARQITRMGTRAAGDLPALADLAAMEGRARDALAAAVAASRAQGYSDADIGAALGVTRQAVWKRFGRQPQVDASAAPGGER